MRRPAETIAIVASCTSNYAEEFDFPARMSRYASRHGHTLHYRSLGNDGTEQAFYNKTATLFWAAATTPASVDWMWWVDCDTVIVNEAVDVADLLRAALREARRHRSGGEAAPSAAGGGGPEPSLVGSYETWGDYLGGHPEPTWGHPVNTGSLFIRKDGPGMAILRGWEHHNRKKKHRVDWNRDQVGRPPRGCRADRRVAAPLGWHATAAWLPCDRRVATVLTAAWLPC